MTVTPHQDLETPEQRPEKYKKFSPPIIKSSLNDCLV
jgi:hypothetical protein